MGPAQRLKQLRGLTPALALLLLAATSLRAAEAAAPPDKPAFSQLDLEQILAPIALYPDSLLSQVLMASTYPLEIVMADRWAGQNKDLKGDALIAALEKQSWDASVKSLINFPPVLAMMSEKIDITTKIGDAFIGQQKQVMETIQKLRAKAQAAGNLKSTPEQKVIVQQTPAQAQVIVIEPASPQVVYVPTYNPTVVYGAWPYPAAPPPPYYPPGYVASNALSFTAGLAVGAASAYAWGHCNWHGGDVDIDVNRNANISNVNTANINREKYQAQYQKNNANMQNGKGSFQHDASHRQGVPYRDQKTATQYGRASSADAAKARESYRGRTDSGRQDASRGPGDSGKGPGVSDNSRGTGGADKGKGPGVSDNSRGAGGADKGKGPGVSDNSRGAGGADKSRSAGTSSGSRGGALDGMSSGGSGARADSSRGSSSRSASPSRSSGGGGGRSSGGGGGRR